MKIVERKQIDRQQVVANKGNHPSEKNKLVNVLNKEPFRNSDFQGTSQIRGSEREWERPFERKKPIICYYCNEVGHIKPACPKLMKTDFETVASLRVNSEDEDCFEKFKVKFEINGVERQCLRDTVSTIDLCASNWIDENVIGYLSQSSEQNKCKYLHVLWERAKWGVSECCGTKKGNLESCWDEERGGIPKTRCAFEIHPRD
ncbi:hypothetical protein TNCV_4088741 [Trichonephila clavipes]|nr:hypothetical protein TNCV_4088741 [Trichonephila clavipes]